MSFDDVIRRPEIEPYVVFRAAFRSGAAVAWGDRDVVHPSGPIRGLLAGVGEIARALPDKTGGAPSRIDTSISVINSRDELGRYLVGTAIAAPAAEYLSDSVLNLVGRLWLGVEDPAAPGTFHEKALTPDLVVTQPPEYDGDVVTLALSSRDAALHVPSFRALRVEQIKDADITVGSTGQLVFADGSTAVVDAGNYWPGINSAIRENRSSRVPWIYGQTHIPMTRVSDDEGPQLFLIGVVAGSKQPVITGAPSWGFFSERYGHAGPWGEEAQVVANFSVPLLAWVAKVPLTVLLDDGTTTSVWALFVRTTLANEEVARERQYVVPTVGYLGLASAPLPSNQGGPARIIEELVKDHGGSVDAASFARCRAAVGGTGFGGVYNGDSAPADVISHIAEAAGIELWTGIDGALRARPAGGWSDADRAASISASTPWIRDGDAQGEVVEVIPVGDMRGAAASRIVVDWPSDVRDFYRDSPLLEARVPGVTSIPQSEQVVATISGAWVDPRYLRTALRSVSLRRLWVTRQIRCIVPPWVATHELGTVMLLSYSRGLGPAGVAGFDRRPVMLVGCTFAPGEDFARAVFDDLSGVADIRPCKVDAYSNWLLAFPSTESLTLVAGSNVVTSSAAFFTAGHVGHYLDMMGAANAANRRQFRIESVPSSTQAVLEFDVAASETIVGGLRSDNPAMHKWCVVRGHEASGGYDYRPDYHRCCIEALGQFRNGEVGQQVMGG